MKLITGNAHQAFAKAVSQELSVPLTESVFKSFSDGETWVEINENIRGEDVFIIQPTSSPANQHLMELLIGLDACRRASAKRVVAVLPYFGYARQDRKPGPRTPITAKLVANLITEAGADRVLTMDLHAGQIQGFFDIPTDNLYALPVFVRDIKDKYAVALAEGKITVVSPDVGGVVRARAFAKRLDADLAIIDKRRERANQSEVMNVIGDVEDRICIIVDDMVDTAGTLCNGAHALLDRGASQVVAYISHGVLSGPALDNVHNSSLTELVISDSIEHLAFVAPAVARMPNQVRQISVTRLFAEAIERIHKEASISRLFETD